MSVKPSSNTSKRHKELIAVEDSYRESDASWTEVLAGLRCRGLKDGPKLANVLAAVPKSVQGKLKEALHNIWMAETQEKAHAAFDQAIAL